MQIKGLELVENIEDTETPMSCHIYGALNTIKLKQTVVRHRETCGLQHDSVIFVCYGFSQVIYFHSHKRHDVETIFLLYN